MSAREVVEAMTMTQVEEISQAFNHLSTDPLPRIEVGVRIQHIPL